MKPHSFASMAWETKRKKTRGEVFLEKMERAVPWAEWVKRIEPYDPKGEDGRWPKGVERMLRIHFMQLGFNPSDPGIEDLIHESEAVRPFAGIGLGEETVPDEGTIWPGSCLPGSGGTWRDAACWRGAASLWMPR